VASIAAMAGAGRCREQAPAADPAGSGTRTALDARDQRGAVSPQDTRILATHAPQVHPVRARGPLTGMAAVLAQGIRGSLPTILSTGLRGPTMLIAQ
jgi:hypothetical protein